MYRSIKIKKKVVIRNASVIGNTKKKIIGSERKNVDKYQPISGKSHGIDTFYKLLEVLKLYS